MNRSWRTDRTEPKLVHLGLMCFEIDMLSQRVNRIEKVQLSSGEWSTDHDRKKKQKFLLSSNLYFAAFKILAFTSTISTIYPVQPRPKEPVLPFHLAPPISVL